MREFARDEQLASHSQLSFRPSRACVCESRPLAARAEFKPSRPFSSVARQSHQSCFQPQPEPHRADFYLPSHFEAPSLFLAFFTYFGKFDLGFD